jgi:hypothetical protein
MKTKGLVACIFVVILMLTMTLMTSCGKKEKTQKISPAELFVIRHEYLLEIEDLFEDVAFVYSQYFTNEIGQEEFKTEVESFKFQYRNIVKRLEEFRKGITMDKDEPYMLVELAIACMDEATKQIGDILEVTIVNDKVMPRGLLFDYYMAKRDKISIAIQNLHIVIRMGSIEQPEPATDN